MKLSESFRNKLKQYNKSLGTLMYIEPNKRSLKHVIGDKPFWVESLAEGYAAALPKALEYPQDKLQVFHVPVKFYVKNKVFLNNLINNEIPICPDGVLVKESNILSFSGSIGLGMFMPFSRVLAEAESKIDYSNAASILKLKDLINENAVESCAPCHSCSAPCIVPDMSSDSLDDDDMLTILKVAKSGNCFCVDCGAKILTSIMEFIMRTKNQDFSVDIAAMKNIDTYNLNLKSADMLSIIQNALTKLTKSKVITAELKSVKDNKEIPSWLK